MPASVAAMGCATTSRRRAASNRFRAAITYSRRRSERGCRNCRTALLGTLALGSMTWELLRELQSGEGDLDQPVDGGFGAEVAGGGEGVQAVSGELVRGDVGA